MDVEAVERRATEPRVEVNSKKDNIPVRHVLLPNVVSFKFLKSWLCPKKPRLKFDKICF
jgi:hypothetical protein